MLYAPNLITSGYCTDAQKFFNRTTGMMSTQAGLYDDLIRGLIADGVWQKLDALWVLAAPTSATALLNLVSSSFGASIAGAGTALTFTKNLGYINPGPNSNASYINLGYNPTTASGKFTQNSAHYSAWSAVSSTSTDTITLFHGMDSGSSQTNLYPKYSDNNVYMRCNEGAPEGGTVGFANTNRQGFWLANRSASTARQGYLNGASLGAFSANTSIAPINTGFLLLWNGAAATYNITDTAAAASVGGSLTAMEALSFKVRMRTYMTAVGVP